MSILNATNIAAELFDFAGPEAQHPAYPCRMICREIHIRTSADAAPIAAHTICVTPDTLDVDCLEELDPRHGVEIRLADDAEGAWTPAVVQHCVGTIIGYTVGLRISE